MPHEKLILVLMAAVATAAILAGVAFARRDSAPAPAVDRRLPEAVARYEAAKQPVRPAKLYVPIYRDSSSAAAGPDHHSR